MKKLLLILLCWPVIFSSCVIEDSNSVSNGESIIENDPVNSFQGYSNNSIISNFLDYMSFYHEGIELDITNIEVKNMIGIHNQLNIILGVQSGLIHFVWMGLCVCFN